MANCSKCKKELYMPFSCKYCGKQFCSEHRLPEKHNCERLDLLEEEKKRAAQAREETQLVTPSQGRTYSDVPQGAEVYEERYDPVTGETIVSYFMPTVQKPDKPILGITSGKELLHLFIGILLMFESVFIMFVFSFYAYLQNYPRIYLLITLLGGLITIGFIGHELSHKFTSLKLDYWAEFRLEKTYALLTAILPWFVMPGAVQVGSSRATKDEMGKIALAGPVYNLVLGAIFMVLAILFTFILDKPSEINTRWWILGFSAFMNVMLGVFNLLPFSVLDGKKIISWSKGAWIFTLIALIGLVLGLIFIPWQGEYSEIGAILYKVPKNLYWSDTDRFLDFLIRYWRYFI
ncbi:MAG: AN1-type zinc finger domain-containing protein [Promethearchaeota archaeon]